MVCICVHCTNCGTLDVVAVVIMFHVQLHTHPTKKTENHGSTDSEIRHWIVLIFYTIGKTLDWLNYASSISDVCRCSASYNYLHVVGCINP